MRIVQFLVEQSGNPSGFFGKLLLDTMDMAHGKVIKKALEPIRLIEEYPELLKEAGFSEIDVFPYSGFMIAHSRK